MCGIIMFLCKFRACMCENRCEFNMRSKPNQHTIKFFIILYYSYYLMEQINFSDAPRALA